ncbi:MAG TPA: branched-chain amino acid ABC transporter permease [Castellaniella sp.]|uniref:branched-chain amino acid ABC transporter permease n=1 Tax=Castellaniella sp. TaxID=1955812 RepID=UPI002EDFD9B8
MLFLQLLVNGIQVGALYALIAVGFSLIFGSTRIFHFAHGATFTIGAYIFYYLYSVAAVQPIVSMVVASAATMVFGVFMDRCVYAPIQRHEGSFFTIFVASLGIGIIVENLIGVVFGRSFVSVSTPLSMSVQVAPGLYVAPLAGIAVVCALVFFLALHFFFTKTHLGMGLRALSESPELIRVYGMSPRMLSTIAFVIGSVLVMPAAILTAASSGMNPSITHHVMLISLAATIVGGVGSLRGAAFAGLLLGIVENLSLMFLGSQWSEAVTFVVLFLFIIFRPTGFFGRAMAS